jgi:hypothetical protein
MARELDHDPFVVERLNALVEGRDLGGEVLARNPGERRCVPARELARERGEVRGRGLGPVHAVGVLAVGHPHPLGRRTHRPNARALRTIGHARGREPCHG